MRRRDVLAIVAGAAFPWPYAARAQQPAMPAVGFITAGSLGALRQQVAAFRDGLKEAGIIEGQNATVEYRAADGQLDRFPALVSDLVRRKVAVLAVTSTAGARAAKQATGTIPIVFSIGEDPVTTGIVDSLNRPGGNMTGVYQFTTGLEAKRLGLLHEMVPKAAIMAVLVNSNFSAAEAQLRDVQEAAARLRVQLVVLRANVESDFEAAFSTLVRERAGALLVCGSPFFNTRRQQLVVLAARHAVPAIYEWRDFAAAGGLMSYGTNLADSYRQAGVYAGRILKGAKPADLPVVQATRFEFVINMNTAKALGIDVPPTLSARADEIIE
jgi:putative ABC transport system substrate-binding protein